MVRTVTLAGALLLGLVLPTLASAAHTTGWVNIRSGAGTKNAVVIVAVPSAALTVHSCSKHWCKVTYDGVTGWASAAHIAHK
jgi:uncharacterized protein YraI